MYNALTPTLEKVIIYTNKQKKQLEFEFRKLEHDRIGEICNFMNSKHT